MHLNIIGIANDFVFEVVEVAKAQYKEISLYNNGYSVEHTSLDFLDISEVDVSQDCALGLGRPENRKKLFYECENMGVESWVSLIADSASVAESAVIAEGVFVNKNAVVASGSKIGRHSIINRLAGVGHHVLIEDFSFIGPGSQVLGSAKIHEGAFIGANSTILNTVEIGENSIIGAGSVVTKDVKPNSVYFGNPAKFIRSL